MALLQRTVLRVACPEASLARHLLQSLPTGLRNASSQADTHHSESDSQDAQSSAADDHKVSDTVDFIKNAATAPIHEAIRMAKSAAGHQKPFSKDDMAPAGNITQARHTDHDKEALYEDTMKKAKSKWKDHNIVESYKHAYDAPEAATATSESAAAKQEDPDNKKL